MTHGKLSKVLSASLPGVRGLSIRSIERFRQEKGIHKTSRLSEVEVKQAVGEAVAKV